MTASARPAGVLDLAATPLLGLDELEFIADGIDHAEGICLTPDGLLYVSGEAGQIYRVADDGTATEVATTGGWTLGLAADAEGRIYACDAKQHCVWRLDPADWNPRSLRPLDRRASRWRTPTGARSGPAGRTTSRFRGTGRRATARSSRSAREVPRRSGRANSVDFPNGLAVSPDGRELWVLESTPGRLVRFAIRPDGTAGEREVIVELPGTVPDGIAFATDGSVVIACYRPDVVLRWRADLGVQVLASRPGGHGTGGSDQLRLLRSGPGNHRRTRTSAAGTSPGFACPASPACHSSTRRPSSSDLENPGRTDGWVSSTAARLSSRAGRSASARASSGRSRAKGPRVAIADVDAAAAQRLAGEITDGGRPGDRHRR